MAGKRSLHLCGSKLSKVLVFLVVVSVCLLAYCMNYWKVSIQTINSSGTTGLHIVARLNWTRAVGSPQAQDQSNRSLDGVDELLSTFGVKDRVNDINVGAGEAVVYKTDPILSKQLSFSANTTTSSTASHLHIAPPSQGGSQQQADYKHSLTTSTPLISDELMVRFFIPNVHVRSVNCAKIIAGDSTEMARAERYQGAHPKLQIPPEHFKAKAKDCRSFLGSRRYTTHPLSKEEADFSIAYSLVIFKDIEQVERLLRAIYRPQNYYCLHVDTKASQSFREAISAITDCFDNVFLSSQSVNVQWGWYSVLEPEIVCMEDLWKHKKWKYFINLTGQEFPLKTNEDIVKILKELNGANNVHGTVKRRNRDRVEYVHQGLNPNYKVKKSPVPVPVTITKGSLHVVVQRGFVDFVLHNKDALEFREWVKDTGVPDETFFSSLNYSPQLKVPGAYTGEPESDHIERPKPRNPFFARFKNWGDSIFNWPCHGQRVRMICVFGIGDLPLLASRKELFANKFHQTYHPLVYDCLEELHYNRTRASVLGKREFDASFYAALDTVKNHVT